MAEKGALQTKGQVAAASPLGRALRTERANGDCRPNVRAKLPAEAGTVSLVRDDAPCAADQAYSACRSGSA